MKKKEVMGKHTRREFLKYGARVGFGLITGATIGGLFGRGYREVRDIYKDDIKPYLPKIRSKEEQKKRLKNLRDYFTGKKNPFEENPKNNEEDISRRSFFGYLRGQADEYPVTTGVTLGGFYGGAKSLISNFFGYRRRKETAKLKDDNELQKKKIENLERRVGELESVNIDRTFIFIGIMGVLFTMFLKKQTLTTFAVLENASINIHLLPNIILPISLLSIIVGVAIKLSKE